MKVPHQGKIDFYPVPDLPGLELVRGTNVSHSFPRHSHRKYCLGIVEKGCRKFSYQDGTILIVPGDILLISPGEVHTCNSLDSLGHSYRMLCLDPNYFDQLFPPDENKETQNSSCFPAQITTHPGHFQKLSQLFSILAESESVLAKESVLLATFGELIGKQKNNPWFPTLFVPRTILLIQEYLEANFAENVTIERLSQLAGLSPYHLIRVFGEKTGLPPHSFQTQIRIKQAKAKLLQGQTIIDTALETGFVDQSHFTKSFKKWVGITPGEFMRKNT